MPLELTDETRTRVHEALQAYFREHFDEDPGLLKLDQLLDFLLKSIGAVIYNQAVGDAEAYLQKKLLDMEADLHERVAFRS